MIPATPASVSELRRLVRDQARRWALPENAEDSLQLIVSELAGNVVLHSGSPSDRRDKHHLGLHSQRTMAWPISPPYP
ncbi:ATP-binding protein [Streptomyces sp. NPDC058525]|uniref:ATP-binding protein n=1 Tax=Streptomyces sp. NPDC058525 TaxID=3346538 RepID=UPI00364EE875